MTIVRKRLMWLLVLACGLWTMTALTACNTTEGVGEDIQEGGEAIEDAAD